MRNTLTTVLIAVLATLGTLFIYQKVAPSDVPATVQVQHVDATPSKGAMYAPDASGNLVPLDFTEVSAKVVHAVVHIKSTQTRSARSPFPESRMPDQFRDFFDDFFGGRGGFPDMQQPMPQVGSGSGVLISDDGYIVTNNHVIDQADDIEVVLTDNRTYKAELVGTDPTTDLALIKVEDRGLPFLAFTDSDQIKVGEWVLAVGNPFSLNSTVTAGIVSAKGRSINILQEQFAVESFIQTDAAINPGNSGGALVDLQGNLVGINTAIASRTGTYNGYGFAVPANIVKKITEDLLTYGVAQRGVLGVTMRSVDGNLAREKNLSVTQGAYVDSLIVGGAAREAGLEKGDVITAVNGRAIRTGSDLQEQIARRRPGDEVTLSVRRGNRDRTIKVVLNNRSGDTGVVKVATDNQLLNDLGVALETVSAEEARELGIRGGVRVTRLGDGKLRRSTNIEKGFIITHVDGQMVYSPEDFLSALKGKSGGVMLRGTYQGRGETLYYGFGM